MGTSRTVTEFAAKIEGMAGATERHRFDVVTEGAKATKAALLEAAAAKGMRPGSRIARKPWSVRYTVAGGASPSALVKFQGPFHLVDRDNRPHTIVPKAARSARGKAKVLHYGDVFAASVQHPGTHGKHIFPAGKKLAERVVPVAMAQKQRTIWSEALK